MTLQERAESVAFNHEVPGRVRYLLANDIAVAIEAACQEAVAAALVEERAQRTLPGAPLTEERLAEIRAAEKAATPGPWKWTPEYGLAGRWHWCIAHPTEPGLCVYPLVSIVYREEGDYADHPDPLFVAAAREAVPALLADNDFLRAILRDANAHGELEQYDRGRDAGLEEAARVVQESNTLEALGIASTIRARKRLTP